MNIFNDLHAVDKRELDENELKFLAAFVQFEQMEPNNYLPLSQIASNLLAKFGQLHPAIQPLLTDLEGAFFSNTNFRMTPFAVCWLSAWCTKSGHSFAIARSLFQFTQQTGNTRISLPFLLNKFNDGIPTDLALDKCWEHQMKFVSSGNSLNQPI